MAEKNFFDGYGYVIPFCFFLHIKKMRFRRIIYQNTSNRFIPVEVDVVTGDRLMPAVRMKGI